MSTTRTSTNQPTVPPSSEAGQRHATFVTTHWSVVLTAQRSDTTPGEVDQEMHHLFAVLAS